MKLKLIHILLCLFSVIAYGQVELSMRPDKTEYNGKEVVNLILILELDGSELQQQTGFQLPDLSKFTMIGSGSVTNTLVDPETNTVIIQKVTKIALEPKQKGKIKIGSVLVTVSNKRYKTEPFTINIKDLERKSLLMPNFSEFSLIKANMSFAGIFSKPCDLRFSLIAVLIKLVTVTPGISTGYWKERKIPL